MSFHVLRRVPEEVRSGMSTRYHPYLAPPISLKQMAARRYFHDRIEAFDKFNHHAFTLGGYLRRYESKRRQIEELGKDMTELEEKMIELHKKMESEGREVVANISSVSDSDCDTDSEEDLNEYEDEVELDDIKADEEITLTPAVVPPPLPPPLPSFSNLSSGAITLPELVTFPNNVQEIVRYVPGTELRVGAHTYMYGIRRRSYKKAVPCDLCVEATYTDHYKCSNYRCKYRVCYDCLVHMDDHEDGMLVCPFCRAPYEKCSSQPLTISPMALPPPAAREMSPEF